MTKFIRSVFILINIGAVAGLFLVKIGSIVSPVTLSLSSYFSYMLLPLAVLNVFFVIFWSFLKKWWFLLSLASIAIFYTMIRTSFPVNFSKPKVNTEYKKIRLLTYNTMSTSYMKPHNNESVNPVIKYILDSDADIVCLQEFAVSENKNQFNEQEMNKAFKDYPYKHIKYRLNRWEMHQGVATFSKFPIINMQNVDFESAFNLSIYSDIKVGNDTIRVINNHLESNRITAQDMKKTAELKGDLNSDKLKSITKLLSERLGIAARVRALQAEKIAILRKSSPYKLIVCGDFNDVPSSYTYTHARGNLHDAFCETETGFGHTFNRSFFRFRIDCIFYDDSFISTRYRRGNLRKASDHYPVQTDLYLKK